MAAEEEEDELINEKGYDYNPDAYKYGDIDGKRIRVSVDDWMDVCSWRDWVKEPYWFKMKPYLDTDWGGYKRYYITINCVNRIMARILFKLYNKNWDITDTGANNKIDHINKNSLDNRIENLRILTHQQNLWNTNARGTIQLKSGKWKAKIMYSGKIKTKEPFDTEPEAHQQYLLLKELYHSIPD